MTDAEFEDLGKLWRKEPSEEEMRELQRSARAVSRRARFAEALDWVLATVAICGAVAIVLYNPEPITIMAAGAAIVLSVIGQRRQLQLRVSEVQSLTGDTASMIERSILRVQATIKRARSGLVVLGPATLLGVFFGFVVDRGGGGQLLPQLRGTIALSIAIFIILATMAHLFYTVRRSRMELKRLILLREAYRLENEHEASEHAALLN